MGGAELSCLGDEIILKGEARVAPPLQVPPPMRPELGHAGYISVLTVAALTRVLAHAHIGKCARARASGAVVGDYRRTELRLLAGGRAGAAMGEVDAGTPSFEMTWSSTTSSGYCSQEDSDSELEQYFTARTSLVRRPRRDQVGTGSWGRRIGGGCWDPAPPR